MSKIFNSANKYPTRLLTYCLACILILNSCKKDYCNKITHDNPSFSDDSSIRFTGKPNIILFIADDLGYEVPQFTGGQSYNTPNLNFMAANGIYFNQAYSHPDGFPSRLALLTGKYNFRNYQVWGKLPDTEKTLGNLLKDAGYATCYVGKWQCGGGDARIHAAGFRDYRVYLPFSSESQREGRYKNPVIYQDADYLPCGATMGKYSEDMFSDYLCKFIDWNMNRSFFAIYAFNLVAAPYVPSPDHPDYAAWNPSNEISRDNPKYFASQVAYLDKMIGKIINKVRQDGLEENTIFMFIADNATQRNITSLYKGEDITGTKTQTISMGTLTPFVVYWKNTAAPGAINNTLIDYTDFLPTFADIAGVSKPTNYGILDGTSFYDNMIESQGIDREWVFCHWDNDIHDNGSVPRERYVNNSNYKLYDTLKYQRFYNIQTDSNEEHPIPQANLTPDEVAIKKEFIQVLQSLHK